MEKSPLGLGDHIIKLEPAKGLKGAISPTISQMLVGKIEERKD